ncbi:MAG: mitochondrial fission ELM1 family protein [Alphaproteobacteria bacterium]|nr:mitochondrial fission ELM1 family protein [Alphaproteobacteria bacterium]
MRKKINCWIITEGIAGTENQCLGVAEALGVEPEVKRIMLRQPWLSLSPYLAIEQPWSFSPRIEEPWPDLLIASGRKSIAASRYIKKKSGGKTFTVQIQDPRISQDNFDLIAVPEHDPTRGENVIVTRAAPNRITDQKLEDAHQQFGTFKGIKKPRVAVLIGGNSKDYTLTSNITKKLILRLQHLDAGLMITASRRTGVENTEMLKAAFEDTEHYIWNGTSENPYFGLLAWADYILVTADSASMLSEACTTGKPVYMIAMDKNRPNKEGRIDKLHQTLKKSGCLRDFEGQLAHWEYARLNDSEMVADEIRKRMGL